jgi:hypothetical protein
MGYTVNLQLERQFAGRVEAGLKAAGVFLAAKTREILSAPAPKARAKTLSGAAHFRAATRATPGAPPRLLTGRLRGSVTWAMRNDRRGVVLSSNVRYAGILERRGHRFLSLALKRHAKEAMALACRVARQGGG